jgi:putative ABC transport system permease protein
MIFYFTKTLLRRSYKYLLLTFFSIAVGAFLFGGSISISQSISNYFVAEGRTLIGGDVVISGARPISTEEGPLQDLDRTKVTLAQEYSVQAVFRNTQSSSTVAASIRAVGNDFPLYGSVVSNPSFSLVQNGIYAEKSFLDRIGASVGEDVLLGDGAYRVIGILEKEPDGVSLGVSFVPTVIMRAQDFNSSNIDLTQSRTDYKILIREDAPNYLTVNTKKAIEAFAKENKLRYDDSANGPNNFVRGLSSVKSFVGIVLAISLFLVVVNIITNLTYVLSKFRKTIAILKTFGATNTQIQIIYSLILSIIGLSAGALGSYLGVFTANSVLPIIASYTQTQITGIAVWPTTLWGGVICLVVILSSALPFFRSLGDITAKQLLANVSTNTKTKTYSSFLLYVPIPLIISVLLYVLSSDIKLVAYSMIGLMCSFALFSALAHSIIRFLYKIRNSFSFIVRSIISSLSWRGYETVIVIASIMTAFSGIFIVSAVETNILLNISQNVSSSAPPLYLVDITQNQIEDVATIAGETFVSYPIIRGRLLSLNEEDLTLSADPGVTREFNMTYRTNLLGDEGIVSGVWHGDTTKNSVSIDDSFAEDIGGVVVGDTIKVFIQGITVEATVTSIRSADRTSGTPFFFLVFSPDVISRFPASFFGTVNVPAEGIVRIQSELGSKYPNIIPIETSTIFSTVSGLVDSVVLALKIIGIPSIILGLILVFVMTGQSIFERRSDVLIFRAFGLQSKSIQRLFILEIISIILIAGIIAYALSHAIAYALNNFLFSFETFTFDTMPIAILIGITVLVSLFAIVVSKPVTHSPLKNLLAEK